MTAQELTELRGRCVVAQQYGRKIANAEGYVAELEKEAGTVALPRGVAKNSAGHLVLLLDKLGRVQSGQEPKGGAAAAPAPAAPPAPPKEAKAKKSRSKKAKKSDDDTLPRVEVEAEAGDDDSEDEAGDVEQAGDDDPV